MRSFPAHFDLVAPGRLTLVLELLAREPGAWLPIAGGTEIMVQFGAGKLGSHKLVNIWGLPELRQIQETTTELRIGAGCTYAELCKNATLLSEFPLLVSGASWTGSIANQNRGTLGGNIVNASPAADSLPGLLAYEAELILVSSKGERRIPYTGFHIGYKRTLLSPEELIRTIVLERKFGQYTAYSRKVGPRNAQAISKLCMAGLAKVNSGKIRDIRVAVGSMAPVPLRLRDTERALNGSGWDEDTMRAARQALRSEVSPIDDIRSNREYRIAVAENLLEEFVRSLFPDRRTSKVEMNPILERWNQLPLEAAAAELLSCCGSNAWAGKVAEVRPYADADALAEAASAIWLGLDPAEWLRTFRTHPRIGEKHAERATTQASAAWSGSEQKNVQDASAANRHAIEEGNRRYEARFGRIFIVCAAGKQPSEILDNLERRMVNDDTAELMESARQQEQIMQLRLRKWLGSKE